MRTGRNARSRMLISFLFAVWLGHGLLQAQKTHTLSGTIRDNHGEVLIGASVLTDDPHKGAISNAYGFYSLTFPAGSYIIHYSYLGYESLIDTLFLNRSVVRDVYLSPANIMLSPVEMRAVQRGDFVHRTGMGKIELQMPVINQMPHLLGETDLFKSLQLLPGIQSAGEGNSGLVVRGGNTDQNLILLDEATVYNPFHLMGFFSVFNRDAIQNVTVYKGDIPAQYGGRLSSLIDVRMKDGNLKRWGISGGIGTISSRLNVEGPIIKDRGSVIVSGRRSYADIFLPLLKNEEIRNNRLYFYDLNAKANIRLNDNNRLYYSIYKGKDAFLLADVVLVTWGNLTQSLRWNHLFSQKLFSNLSLIYNTYEYNLGKNAAFTGVRWESGLEDVSLKYDFSYFPGKGHTIRFGAQSIYHSFNPGYLTGITSESIYNNLQLPRSAAIESAIYYGHEYKVSEKFAIEAGMRYSGFFGTGEATIYLFNEDYFPYDTLFYGPGDRYSPYGGFEPRLGLRYSFGELSSVKLNYSRTRQYLHLASNSTSDSPLDVWLPSSPNLPLQTADHLAIGYFRNISKNFLVFSLEVYYKKMYNQVDFRDNARIFLNPLLEGEFRVGEGRAYGTEFLLRKQEGRLTGWIAYTLSRSVREIEGVNQGKVYPADHSRTHDFSLVGHYSLSERTGISSNWVFVSGLPVTFPSGRFEYGNTIVPVYTDRNAHRMPSYHRLDISMTLKNRVKAGKRFRDEWVFSIYNAYYRKNAWLIYFVQSEENPDETEARKLYMFPIIPSVSYNFRF